MYTVWFIASCIFAVVWLIILGMGIYFIVFDGDGTYYREKAKQKEDFQAFSAAMAAGMAFVLFHWIIVIAVLVLAIPFFLLYGTWQGIKLLAAYRRQRKEDKRDKTEV